MPKASTIKKPFYKRIFERFSLLGIYFLVLKRNLFEQLKIIFFYYSNIQFLKTDLYLLFLYLFQNPYRINQRFLKKRGESNIYTYGETPLTTLETIVNECGINYSDTVFELGSGRGRSCFWLSSFIQCKIIGCEIDPIFYHKATKVQNYFQLPELEFIFKDMYKIDFSNATVIYLYGTCLEKTEIKQLLAQFQNLKPGAKVISVSYSLIEYTSEDLFTLVKTFPATFTWGTANVYLQVKN